MKLFRSRRAAPAVLALLCIAWLSGAAANEHFIYGTVLTRDGESHRGMLRWEDEEVFWTDHFNGTKADNAYIEMLSPEDREYLKSGRPIVVEHWTDAFAIFGRGFDADEQYIHSFRVRFGDIDRIVRQNGDRVDVYFRNGDVQELDGGSNDIGATVQVLTSEGQEIEVRWRELEEVRLAAVPGNMRRAYGRALSGTVTTDAGEFGGLVQWDHDERLSVDVLDGERDGEDVSLPFERIAAIRNDGNASEVVTTDGETFRLTGTNDVNNDNRGIIVDVEGLGRVDIPWERFRSVEFTGSAASPAIRAGFPEARPLHGTIEIADGGKLRGRLVFDLDEGLDAEMFDGSAADIDYSIPFRYIKRLEPQDMVESVVYLRDGRRLRLRGDDAGAGNDGLLVFSGEKSPRFVRWEDVSAVEFD